MIAALLLAAAIPSLSCGAATRPGIAERGEDGVWRGLAVDWCRRVAKGRPVAFHGYDTPAALAGAAKDGVAFLSPDELASAGGALIPGPFVTTERQVMVVPPYAPAASLAALSGHMICFIIGTRAETALNAWSNAAGVPVERLAFQEWDEMQDGYHAGKCAGMAIDAAEVSDAGDDRVLAEPLASVPIRAATPRTAGSGWAATVAAALSAPSTPGRRARATP